MDTQTHAASKIRVLDKPEVPRMLDDLNERMRFEPDPTGTAERARAMQVAEGLRAEDNGASRKLMRMRYCDNWKAEFRAEGLFGEVACTPPDRAVNDLATVAPRPTVLADGEREDAETRRRETRGSDISVSPCLPLPVSFRFPVLQDGRPKAAETGRSRPGKRVMFTSDSVPPPPSLRA